jgi:hypothetical protein
MRFRGPLGPSVLGVGVAGVLLLLLSGQAAPLRAAAPPASVYDPRKVWASEDVRYQLVSPGRWVETNPTGKVVYRENNRHKDYVELYESARRRFVRLYSFGHYVYVPEKEHFKRIGHGGWDSSSSSSPQARPLDLTRNAADRHVLGSEEQKRSFPRLGNRFEVMGPATVAYNCICWSLGNDNSWVWPKGPGQPVTLADFDVLYGLYGFKRVSGLDYRRQPGVEKVVVFAVERDGRMEVTHACKQQPDGTWSSKLGSLPLIRHLRPDDVAGPTYGAPYAVYVRTKR